MSTDEAPTPNIHQRINAVMQDVPYVQKVQRKTGLQYTFVNRDGVVSKLRVAMVKHGITYFPNVLSFTENGNRITATVEHTYTNSDTPDDRIVFSTVGYGIDPQDKGPGKAVTYAEKLAHLKLFMIEAGDEDECEHYDEPHKPEAGGDTGAAKDKKSQGKRAEVVTGSLDDLKTKYVDTAKKYSIDLKAFGEAFGGVVPESKRKDAAAVNTGLIEMEKRCCAWLDVLEAIEKWSVSGAMFDAAVGKIVGGDEVVSKDNYFFYPSATLSKLADQVHADNDLPFDNEGKAIPK